MSPMSRLIEWAWVAAPLVLILLLPDVALAHDCSSLADCWSTAAGAAGAAAGAGVAAGASAAASGSAAGGGLGQASTATSATSPADGVGDLGSGGRQADEATGGETGQQRGWGGDREADTRAKDERSPAQIKRDAELTRRAHRRVYGKEEPK